MKNRKFIFTTAFSIVTLLFSSTGSAQVNSEQKELMKAFVAAADKIPPDQTVLLSSGMRRFLDYAARVSASQSNVTEAEAIGSMLVPSVNQFATVAGSGPDGTIRVSNPALDFASSVFIGFTQNTTSSARCGNSVVVGYEDTAAGLRSSGGSMDGVSYSADGGQTFTELPFLPRGASPNVLAGDPVVACSSSSRFYYASLLETETNGCPTPVCPSAGISVSISTNGGKTWGNPIKAAAAESLATLDKPWLAVDPTNPMRLYLTYTDSCCGWAIKLVRSSDGGATWSAPVVLDQQPQTSEANVVTGSNVVVAPDGKVYVAFEFFGWAPSGIGPRELRFTRSLDHGGTFSAPIKVSDVIPSGIAGIVLTGLQANLYVNDFPQLAVDRSNGPSRGTLYIAWPDGRDHVKPDAIGARFSQGQPTYAFADILVVKSTNQGQSFTVPSPVSPTPATFRGRGRDQFLPGIAVDATGKVAACYYDRRNDPTNMAIDRYCSVSLNAGATWQDLRVSAPSWLPVRAEVFGNNISEYDALSSDFLLQNAGFFAAFEIEEDGNPNIVSRKF